MWQRVQRGSLLVGRPCRAADGEAGVKRPGTVSFEEPSFHLFVVFR